MITFVKTPGLRAAPGIIAVALLTACSGTSAPKPPPVQPCANDVSKRGLARFPESELIPRTYGVPPRCVIEWDNSKEQDESERDRTLQELLACLDKFMPRSWDLTDSDRALRLLRDNRELGERARAELIKRRHSIQHDILYQQSLVNDIRLFLAIDAAVADEGKAFELLEELEKGSRGDISKWLAKEIALSLWRNKKYSTIIAQLEGRLLEDLAVKERDDLMAAATGRPGFFFPFAYGALYESLLAENGASRARAIADRMLGKWPRSEVYIALMKHAARVANRGELARLLARSELHLEPAERAEVAKAWRQLQAPRPQGSGNAVEP